MILIYTDQKHCIIHARPVVGDVTFWNTHIIRMTSQFLQIRIL